MYYTCCIAACIASAIVTVLAFFLYVRARFSGQDRLESRYQTIHFITLGLFVLFGVLILVHLSGRLNRGTIL